MKADRNVEDAVISTLDKFIEAYLSKDIHRTLSFFAPDPDIVYIGTGADEKRIGLNEIKKQLERDREQYELASVEMVWNSVSAAGSVAWTTSDVIIRVKAGGKQISFPGRMTAVLEKRGDKWLLVQRHFSVPAAEQAEGESLPYRIQN